MWPRKGRCFEGDATEFPAKTLSLLSTAYPDCMYRSSYVENDIKILEKVGEGELS